MFSLSRTDADDLRRHVAILLVAGVDRRILPAVRFVSTLPETDVRALHVSVDDACAAQLGIDWLEFGLSWVPLDIYEADHDRLEASVQSAIRREADRFDGITAVLPELNFPKWWHPLFHRGRARRIARELQTVPGVTPVLVPYALNLV